MWTLPDIPGFEALLQVLLNGYKKERRKVSNLGKKQGQEKTHHELPHSSHQPYPSSSCLYVCAVPSVSPCPRDARVYTSSFSQTEGLEGVKK